MVLFLIYRYTLRRGIDLLQPASKSWSIFNSTTGCLVREKIKTKKTIDVLLSSDTTEVQGFLQEGGDDCALVVFRDEEDEDEMEGTGIPWVVIGEAVGAEEQLERRRSGRVREARELYEGEEFSSEEEEYESDEDEDE